MIRLAVAQDLETLSETTESATDIADPLISL